MALLLMFTSLSFAQQPKWLDAQQYSKGATVVSNDFTVDREGSRYYAGYVNGTTRIGGKRISTNNPDAIVAKFNSKDSLQWLLDFGGSNFDQCSYMHVDDSFNVYVTGSFFGKITVDGTSYTSAGSYDAFLIKIDSSGDVKWTRIAEGTNVQQAAAVTVDSSGYVYWTGQYFGSTDFENTTLSQASGNYDVFLAKYGPTGKLVRVTGFGGNWQDVAKDMDVYGDQLVIGGNFIWTLSIGSTSITATGSRDAFICSMDTSFSLDWLKKGGSNGADDLNSLKFSDRGEILVSGTFSNTFSLGGKSVSGGFNEGYVARLEDDGDALFIKSLKSSGFGNNLIIKDFFEDKHQNFVAAGYFNSSVTIGSKTYNGNGGFDIMLAGFKANGVLNFFLDGGGSDNETMAGACTDSNGYYFVGGYHAGNASFGSTTLKGTGNFNTFLAKGIPPISRPRFRNMGKRYVYKDSTFSRSYSVNSDPQPDYSLVRGPDGLTFKTSNAVVTWTPDSSDVGAHWVVLKASNLGGTVVDSFRLEVIKLPAAAFDFPVNACVDNEILLADVTPNAGPLGIEWFIDDSLYSTKNNFRYTFEDTGHFVIKMRLFNVFGEQDSISDSIHIHPNPVARYVAKNSCMGDTMRALNRAKISRGRIDSVYWLVNDSVIGRTRNYRQFFALDSQFTLKLEVHSDKGCTDQFSRPIHITPKPTASYFPFNACEADEALFFDQSQANGDTIEFFTWHFGDGKVETVSSSGISHFYKSSGSFNTKLIVTTDNGCKDSSSQSITVYPKPVADFSIDDICLGKTILLEDKSSVVSGNIIARRWITGDGKAYSKKYVNHKYTKTGTYNISLIVNSDRNCSDTMVNRIAVSKLANASFSLQDSCNGGLLEFESSVLTNQNDSIAEINWYIDGQLEFSGSSDFRYQLEKDASNPNVKLEMRSKNGCEIVKERTVNLLPVIAAEFSVAEICEGDTVIIETDFNQEPDSLRWVALGADVFEEDGNWMISPQIANQHQLFLRTWADNGCQDSAVEVLSFKKAPVSEIIHSNDWRGRTTLEADDPSHLSYNWSIDGVGDFSGREIDFQVNQPDSYRVTLTLESQEACQNVIEKTIYIDFNSSIENVSLNTWSIFPQPARDRLTILSDISSPIYQIFDLRGKRLLSGRGNEVDLSRLSSGQYILTITDEDNHYFLKRPIQIRR